MDASIDPESKSQEKILRDDIEQVDQGEKRDAGKNFEPNPEEQRKQTTGANCSDNSERDDLGKADASMDFDLKSREGTLSNAIELVDQGEKMDEGKNFKSKPEQKMKQTVGESCSESDSVSDRADVPELEANRSSFLHSFRAGELIDSKQSLVEKNIIYNPTSEGPVQDSGGNIVKSSLLESKCQTEKRSDSMKYDNLGEMDARMDQGSKSGEVTVSNDIEKVDQDEENDMGKNFEPKPEEGRKQATRENCGDSIEHDDLGEMNTSKDQGTSSNGIEQVDCGETMDVANNLECKPGEEIKQTTWENHGKGVSDSVFDGAEVPELEVNRSTSLHSSGVDALMEKIITDNPTSERPGRDAVDILKDNQSELFEEIRSKEISNDNFEINKDTGKFDGGGNFDESSLSESKCQIEKFDDSIKHGNLVEMDASMDYKPKSQEDALSNDIEHIDQGENEDQGINFEPKKEERKHTPGEDCSDGIKHDDLGNMEASVDFDSKSQEGTLSNDIDKVDQSEKMDKGKNFESKPEEEMMQTTAENRGEESNPVSDGPEVVQIADRCIPWHSSEADAGSVGSVQPEKATTFRNLVKGKGIVAVSSFLRAFSGKFTSDEKKDASDSANREVTASQKLGDISAWNPLSYIMVSRYADAENKTEQGLEVGSQAPEPIAMKGRIILYTRLGCQNCREVRSFLYNRRLRYVEINIDVYPSRKKELEKFTGSCVVPKVFFNEIVIGGLNELKGLDESGKLEEKLDFLITEEPAYEAPLPPLSGEDDMSSSGTVDELALIVRKMKESIVVKDRFYKMRRFSKCFLGSEAVNFLSEDQCLEREEAIEFGRKLARKLFFQHVLDEHLFEDGNHFYWFLDDNPILSSQCHNIPRGIIEAKPKPIREIASRLRFLSSAIYEAYTSEDGKHVDYRTIHGSEEFARYLRIIQELQRVELQDIPREEKLAFFINLFNMMIIHAILIMGPLDGAMQRRKLLGDFKYVIGGCSYSLSTILNGILRCNQGTIFSLMKPFSANDKHVKVALPYPEPLIHFALCLGTRSGPALRCYSPGNIDKELMDSARNFLRAGGLAIDLHAKVAYLSKIFKWFSEDFGDNEVEVLKHASNYLEPAKSEALLELLQEGQLKAVYQPYDWGLNL